MKLVIIIIFILASFLSVEGQDIYATASTRAMERFYLDTATATVKEDGKSYKATVIFNVHAPTDADTFHIDNMGRRVGYTTISVVEIYSARKRWQPQSIKIGVRPRTFTIKKPKNDINKAI